MEYIKRTIKINHREELTKVRTNSLVNTDDDIITVRQLRSGVYDKKVRTNMNVQRRRTNGFGSFRTK